MPLKHITETTLVAVLGLAMVLTGIVMAILTAMAAPWFLWIAAFIVAIAYPLVLYPHFRERRADYEFRLLHFLPAAFLLLWLLLTIVGNAVPIVAFLRSMLAFAWGLPLVLLGFIFLGLFCVQVMRQSGRRIVALLALFLPFALFGLLGDRFDWNTRIASVIEGPVVGGSSSSSPVAVGGGSSKSVSQSSRAAVRSSAGSVSSKPPRLPHAGAGAEFFAVLVPAATSAAVHLRAMRRARG